MNTSHQPIATGRIAKFIGEDRVLLVQDIEHRVTHYRGEDRILVCSKQCVQSDPPASASAATFATLNAKGTQAKGEVGELG